MSKLSAWERWELNSLEDQVPPAKPGTVEPALKLPTVEELDRIRQEAQEEGYSAGYAAGRAAAQEEATRIGDAAVKLEHALGVFDQQVGEELVALAMEIARQVVRQEITARPEAILEVVREALLQLPHQHAAIYLHPEDAKLVREGVGEALTHAGHRIHEDPSLARGDCLFETGGSQLDATVATRWRRVIENLGLNSAWDDAEDS
jgi:flagellar assembly protein FliH